jgi:hypothetical protein
VDDWRVKISVLWLFYTTAFLAALALGTLEPGILNQFLDTGEIGGLKVGQDLLFLFAVLILVPLVMAFLSLTLRDSITRWANVIVGIFYTGFQIFALIGTLTSSPVYAYAVLIETTKAVVPALIVWNLWKFKRPS